MFTLSEDVSPDLDCTTRKKVPETVGIATTPARVNTGTLSTLAYLPAVFTVQASTVM